MRRVETFLPREETEASPVSKDGIFGATADEDFGSNVGEYTIIDGEVTEYYSPDSGSDEAYDMAADILGYDPREEEGYEEEIEDEDED